MVNVPDGMKRPPCADTLGAQTIESDPDAGTLRVSLEGKPEFCNPNGNIQGGFLAAMLDNVIGPLVMIGSGGTQHCATIDLNVSYLTPAPPGTYVGVGRIVKMGRTVAFLEGELFGPDDQCVARATSSARVFAMSGRDAPGN